MSATPAVKVMTRDEARACADAINSRINEARALILDLYERKGWEALGYNSWRACVVAEFEQSKTHLYRQLEAARIEREISPFGEIGRIPEGQLRPLSQLDPPQKVEAWTHAVETAPNGRPTAAHVKSVIDELFPRSEPVEAVVEDPFAGWSASELERKEKVENCISVLANQRTDHRLIEWAKANDCYVPIDRHAYPLGNPMKMDDMHDREAVIAWYRDHWLPFMEDYIDWSEVTDGKVLGCWCYPEPCHGDVILATSENYRGVIHEN